VSADRETIYERFGFVVEDDLTGLIELAKKESADEDESLLTAVCIVEELESSARHLRHRLEEARGKLEPHVGWRLVHETHVSRTPIEVCVKSERFVHRFGTVIQIDDDGFVLHGASISQGPWRHVVAWSDVAAAWLRGAAPDLCPVCDPAHGEVAA
jgi:hypothetical protein